MLLVTLWVLNAMSKIFLHRTPKSGCFCKLLEIWKMMPKGPHLQKLYYEKHPPKVDVFHSIAYFSVGGFAADTEVS